MEFQNWNSKIDPGQNVIPKLDTCQKWNSKIGPWPKIEFQNWTLAKNGIPPSKIGPKNGIPKLDPEIPKLDTGQK